MSPSSDMVFAPLRQSPEQTLIPVINCDSAPVSVEIMVPAPVLDGGGSQVVDLLSGAVIRPADQSSDKSRRLSIELEPYGVKLLDFMS